METTKHQMVAGGTRGLHVPSSPEFRLWAARAAEHERLPLAKMAELALIDRAKASGFQEAPPKR